MTEKIDFEKESKEIAGEFARCIGLGIGHRECSPPEHLADWALSIQKRTIERCADKIMGMPAQANKEYFKYGVLSLIPSEKKEVTKHD